MSVRLPFVASIASLVLAACAGATTATRPVRAIDVEPAMPSSLVSDLTTATYLGTLHERHYIAEYSLSEVEAAVRSFRPDVVLVELPPDDVAGVCAEVDALGEEAGPTTLENVWVRTLPELYRVVIPLRHELGYDVVGISGWTPEAMADRAAYYEAWPHGPEEREYIVANAAFHAAFLRNDGWNDPTWLHGDEYMETLSDASRWLAYFAEERMGRGGALRVQARHAALLADALERYPGERVLVVFDVTARWALEPVLGAHPDVHHLSAAAFLP